MKTIIAIGAAICLVLGCEAVYAAIQTCWQGYVSPPLRITDLLEEMLYAIFSFVPIILIFLKLDTKKWWALIIGMVEMVVIAYTVCDVVEMFRYGH